MMRLLNHPTSVAQRVPLFSTAEIFLAVLVLISISNQKRSFALLRLFEIIAQKGFFPFTASPLKKKLERQRLIVITLRSVWFVRDGRKFD